MAESKQRRRVLQTGEKTEVGSEQSTFNPTRRDTHVSIFHRFTSAERIPFCRLARLLLLLLMAFISMVTRLAISSLTDISKVPLPTPK